jgi:hypothetical protein
MGETGVPGGAPHVQLLALSGLGRLRLADTVYLTREGPKTVGFLSRVTDLLGLAY